MRPTSRHFILCILLGCCLAWVSGCPATPIGPGDGGEQSNADGAKSDGTNPDTTADTTPEPRAEPRAEPTVEPRPEPGPEPRPEPVEEKAPEPRAEPAMEPSLDATSDAGPETTPEVRPEPRPEMTMEQAPDQSPPTIGDPCKVDADCGGTLVCVPEGQPASFPFPQSTGNGPPGGYCSARCFAGGTMACPQGSECYVPGAASGMCLKTCKADTDCRNAEGYRCANDGGMQSKACFPPTCSLTQPDGNYWMNVTSSRTSGSCSQQPMASGSRIPVQITISAGEITFQFGSKPQSPLPVTWSLIGTYQTSSQFTAANPKGCTQACDGFLKAQVGNPCLFYGSLTSKVDANCNHEYEASFSKRP